MSAMAASEATLRHITLARSLPPRLLNFFKKYPPSPTPSPSQPEAEPTVTIASNTSSSDANANTGTEISSTTTSLSSDHHPQNPFVPFRHPKSTHWHPPAFSLRQQAELVSLARQHNVLSLLPPSSKSPEVREAKRIEHGLRVKGTGVGQKVKGKAWERTLKGRLEERRKAMMGMDEMVKEWKQRGHGRGWKKWPK